MFSTAVKEVVLLCLGQDSATKGEIYQRNTDEFHERLLRKKIKQEERLKAYEQHETNEESSTPAGPDSLRSDGDPLCVKSEHQPPGREGTQNEEKVHPQEEYAKQKIEQYTKQREALKKIFSDAQPYQLEGLEPADIFQKFKDCRQWIIYQELPHHIQKQDVTDIRLLLDDARVVGLKPDTPVTKEAQQLSDWQLGSDDNSVYGNCSAESFLKVCWWASMHQQANPSTAQPIAVLQNCRVKMLSRDLQEGEDWLDIANNLQGFSDLYFYDLTPFAIESLNFITNSSK
eukprot:TRINITY_DN51578_c0_g1_i1.p1 TRINITY_DN51578_c0_g1~~TRINITY_DN51578_c0_g1_i1.p1  ORF type:complete len:287 (+),score=24.31 TRINITY_DN51578_c0_g1_i1:28-888(+)